MISNNSITYTRMVVEVGKAVLFSNESQVIGNLQIAGGFWKATNIHLGSFNKQHTGGLYKRNLISIYSLNPSNSTG